MDRLIYIAMTGAVQQFHQQSITANNLANAATVGYKAETTAFRTAQVTGPGVAARAYAMASTDGADLSAGAIRQTAGILGDIYSGAQSRFNNPVNLKRLVSLIDEVEWTALGVDIKAAAYEGLLEKNAEDVKGGAGQYFTPRPLIRAMVEAVSEDFRRLPEVQLVEFRDGDQPGDLLRRIREHEGSPGGFHRAHAADQDA